MSKIATIKRAIEKLEQLKLENTKGPTDPKTRRLRCRFPECVDRVSSKHLCTDHLMLSKITIGPDCWFSSASCNSHGYAQYGRGRDKVFRRVYELTFGPIPDGLVPDHLCRDRACVNPIHLELVTPRENTLRGVGPSALAARATNCPQGHAYDTENTYRPPSGGRYCKKCRHEQDVKSRDKFYMMGCADCTSTGGPLRKSAAYARVRKHVASTGHNAFASAVIGGRP